MAFDIILSATAIGVRFNRVDKWPTIAQQSRQPNMAWCSERLLRLLGRKKTLDTASVLTTELRRCLSTLDLTFFGAGIMVGVGVFVLTGTMVRDLAGPAAFLSYMISGFVALLNALCYAELGARLPRAGSAYVYTYVAIGEPWAFFVGWNMILEHTVSTAVVSKGFSGTLNAMTGDVIGNWSLSHLVPLMGTQIQDYPDLVAVAMVIVTMLFVLYGVRESVSVNNLISVLLLFVLVLLIVVGFLHADLDNWVGVVGGFLPFGWRGIMRGAATCFYAFVGFESIAVAGEETRDPSRSIPIALSLSLLLVTTLYVLCSATLGLMVPYYLVDLVAPYPDAFARSGVVWAKYVVGIGSLFAYATSLLGALYMTCRTLYAMANDGLLFAILSRVYPRTQTPVVSILATVAMAVPLALLLDLEILVECVSIGTLMSLVTVSMSVLVLRYRPAAKCTFDCRLQQPNEKVSADDQGRLTDASDLDNSGKLKVWLQSSWLNVSIDCVHLSACHQTIFAGICVYT